MRVAYLFALLISLGLSLVLECDAAAERIKIGLAIPLSGPVSFLGQNTLHGAQLFLEEHPDVSERVQLVIEDVTSNTAQGISAVQKLLSTPQIRGLIIEMSPVANASAPLIDKKRVPTIAIVGDDSARNRTHMVKLWMPAINEAKVVAQYLAQINPLRIALVTAEQDSMLARSKALRSLIPKESFVLDSQLTSIEEIPSIATKIMSVRPSVVVMNFMPGQFGALAKRLNEQQYKGALVGNAAMTDQGELEVAQGALDHAVYPDSVQVPSFVERFKKRYSVYPGLAAANGYDAMGLFAKAFAEHGWNPSTEQLNGGIRVARFTGALGTYAFSADEWNVFDLPAIMQNIANFKEQKTNE